MTPRRLLPYLLLFLALAGTYAALKLHQDRREAQEQETKKIFKVAAGDIGELTLIRGNEEIRLIKEDKEWRLAKPLKAKADQEVMDALLTTMAHLVKERDLGAGADLKSFGLEAPALVVAFTAQGQHHRLVVGAKAPGDRSCYALKDQERNLLLISVGDKDSLNRPLAALRDKTLLTFSPEQVKAVRIKTGNSAVTLEKTAPQKWRWVGRDDFQVRGDRVETLLRRLNGTRAKEFVTEAPQDLRTYGLSPQPQAELAVVLDQGQEKLWLGGKTAAGVYARKGEVGPVVLVDQDLPQQITKTLTSLEERRLWAGPVTEVHKISWGTPPQPWVAVKEKDFWKITGPEGRELRQPAVRLEMALWKLTQLEYQRLAPTGSGAAKGGGYLLEVFDGAGKQLFHLEELGQKGEAEVEVRTRVEEKTAVALISRKDYTAWQEEMARLTAPPMKKE